MSTATLVLLLLASCQKQHAFPNRLPADGATDSQYVTFYHDLSPLKRYRFFIELPRDWKVLDAKADRDPKPDELLDVGAFREPGAWMSDPSALARGEVTVGVIGMGTGSLRLATNQQRRQWLLDRLRRNVKELTVLRSGPDAGTPDVLVQYAGDGGPVIARIRVMAAPEKMFLLTGSAPASEYDAVATTLYEALATFRLADNVGSSPARAPSNAR